MSFKVSSSSISLLFWTSSTATRLSRHFTYSFFRRRHSLAASLKNKKKKQKGKQNNFCMLLTEQTEVSLVCVIMVAFQIWNNTPNSISNTNPNWILKGNKCPFHVHMAISRIAASPALIWVHSKQGPSPRQLLCFMAIKIFKGLEFLNESLVLVFKHSHTIFKTFDIFFLLPATLPSSFPGTNTRQMTQERPPSTVQRGSVNFGPTNSTANQS